MAKSPLVDQATERSQEGKAKVHMCDFKDVTGTSPPCNCRGAASGTIVVVRGQARLSLSLLAYQLPLCGAPRWRP